ncbi:MAG: DUF3379 family protein [Shewanella sp.]
MDELRFRRQAVIDPHCQEEDFIQAATHADKADFLEQMQTLDGKIHRALDVPPPPLLADKLLLNSQLKSHAIVKRRMGMSFAIAASIAFISVMTLSLLRLAPINLSEHALAHTHHETKALQSESIIPIAMVNAKLAQLFPGSSEHFVTTPGDILYATYCDFQGVKSLHLVLQQGDQKVTLYIVPKDERFQLASNFNDDDYIGAAYSTPNAYMLLVANNQQALITTRSHIETSFI